MGQYYYIVNIDKKQFLYPHKFDDGLKLMEFGQSSGGTLLGLTILLASGNGRGGGDVFSKAYCKAEEEYMQKKDAKKKFPSAKKYNDSIIGSWAGNRIVIAGDYGDSYKHIPRKDRQKLYEKCLEEQQDRENISQETKEEYAKQNCNLHNYAQYFCEDISDKVVSCLVDCDEWPKDKENSLRPDMILMSK